MNGVKLDLELLRQYKVEIYQLRGDYSLHSRMLLSPSKAIAVSSRRKLMA
jgi:hypothetical protein